MPPDLLAIAKHTLLIVHIVHRDTAAVVSGILGAISEVRTLTGESCSPSSADSAVSMANTVSASTPSTAIPAPLEPATPYMKESK